MEQHNIQNFLECITCKDKDICPIPTPSVSGKLFVPQPSKCILDQLPAKEVAGLAIQIRNRIGLLRLEEERLNRQLKILDNMLDFKKKIIVPNA